jgi:hypothetical protein
MLAAATVADHVDRRAFAAFEALTRCWQRLALTPRFFDKVFSRIQIKCMMYFNRRSRLIG